MSPLPINKKLFFHSRKVSKITERCLIYNFNNIFLLLFVFIKKNIKRYFLQKIENFFHFSCILMDIIN